MELNKITPELFEDTPEAIQDQLKSYVSVPKQKYQEMELLIETLYMMRDDLIDMGMLDSTAAPMFFSESIANNIRKLFQDQRSQIVEQCARIACSYDSEPWQHSPAYSHVADMVSVEIAKNIRKSLEIDYGF